MALRNLRFIRTPLTIVDLRHFVPGKSILRIQTRGHLEIGKRAIQIIAV